MLHREDTEKKGEIKKSQLLTVLTNFQIPMNQKHIDNISRILEIEKNKYIIFNSSYINIDEFYSLVVEKSLSPFILQILYRV